MKTAGTDRQIMSMDKEKLLNWLGGTKTIEGTKNHNTCIDLLDELSQIQIKPDARRSAQHMKGTI